MIALLTACAPGFASADSTRDAPPPAQWSGGPGTSYSFDGVFYNYANDQGQGIALWVPPGEGSVRGVILFGNPGGGLGGDTRDKSRQRNIVEFAARHRFGVAGVTGFPGRSTYQTLGKQILEAFEQWGGHGVHPELADVPFIFTGSSNAGMFSFAMMMVCPQRTIGITPNVGPSYEGDITDAVRAVPAWIHIGTTDPLLPSGVEVTEALFDEHLPKGALWTWEAEIKGHQNGASDHVDMAYWDAIIDLRLPRDASGGLRPLDPAKGWRTDLRSWDYTIARVFPAIEPLPHPDTPARYGWAPTEGIARIYQAAATRARNFTIRFVDRQAAEGGSETGSLLSAGGTVIASPGDKVTIAVDLAPLQGRPETIEVYDRAEKLGEIGPDGPMQFTLTVDDRHVYSLHTRAVQRRRGPGVERVSNPLAITVRDPALSSAIDAQWKRVDWLTNLDRRALDPAEADAATKGSAPTIEALAVGGSPVDERTWLRAEAVALAPRDVRTHVSVRAVYGEAGLHLRFELRQPGGEFGELDFHLAGVGLVSVAARPVDLGVYSNPRRFGILCRSLQFAVPVGEGGRAVSVNHWDPRMMVTTALDTQEKRAAAGLRVERGNTDEGGRRVELFLPWKLVGNPGFASKPAAGTSLAVVLGYNAPGGERIRWPFQRDPWHESPYGGAPIYGQIVLK